MTDRIAFRIPRHCRFCEAGDVIVLDYAEDEGEAVLRWYCPACQWDWPVSVADQQHPARRRGAIGLRWPAPA